MFSLAYARDLITRLLLFWLSIAGLLPDSLLHHSSEYIPSRLPSGPTLYHLAHRAAHRRTGILPGELMCPPPPLQVNSAILSETGGSCDPATDCSVRPFLHTAKHSAAPQLLAACSYYVWNPVLCSS